MSTDSYRAFQVKESENGFEGTIVSRQKKVPQAGEVLIRVLTSSMNYKDFLSASGNRGITRKYPHIPGIDAAGVVEKSASDTISAGAEVIVTGYDLGMNTDGGWGEYLTVPAHWVVKKPTALSFEAAMALGTAGFTAAQSVEAIIEKIGLPQPSTATPAEPKKVIVSGASGGVGSLSLALLSKLGYHSIALSRKKATAPAEVLQQLGANEVIDHSQWLSLPELKKPLAKVSCDAAIDTVGGRTLTNLLKLIRYRGVVACCGMVGGTAFESSIFPFILRGVSLVGIDSAQCPQATKQALWEKLASDWHLPPALLKSKSLTLEEIKTHLPLFKTGAVIGRLVIKHQH